MTGVALTQDTWPPGHAVIEGSGNSIDLDTVESPVFGDPCSLNVRGHDNRIVLGPGVTFRRFKVIVEGSDCELIIEAGCRIRDSTIKLHGRGCSVRIGAGTTVEGAIFLAQEDGQSITLGKDCMLSRDIMLRTSDSHGIFDLDSNARINPPQPIALGDHVWVGRGVRVGKGVRIGDGAVVAQSALVVGNVDANTVVGGVPAKTVRERIRWTRARDAPAGE